MTRLRAALVNGGALAAIARAHELGIASISEEAS